MHCPRCEGLLMSDQVYNQMKPYLRYPYGAVSTVEKPSTP